MPLQPGSDRATISANIREMIKAGHPQKVAVAAALSNARRHPRGLAAGGPGVDRRAIARYGLAMAAGRPIPFGGWWRHQGRRSPRPVTPGHPTPVNGLAGAAAAASPDLQPGVNETTPVGDAPSPAGGITSVGGGLAGGTGTAAEMGRILDAQQQVYPHDYFDLPKQFFDPKEMAAGAIIGNAPMGGTAASILGPIAGQIYGQQLGPYYAGATKSPASVARGFAESMPVAGPLMKLSEYYAGTPYARAHPMASYLYGGNADMGGANAADALYRAGAGVGPMAAAYDEMLRQANLGGAGDTAQTRADIAASQQQIADAIAMGRADPYYTAGNIGGLAANTINAANNTGIATYPGLPMDIRDTIGMAQRTGTLDPASLAPYGLAVDSQGNIVAAPSGGSNQTVAEAVGGDPGYGTDAMGGYDPGAGSNEAGYNDSASYDNTGGGGFDPGFLQSGGAVRDGEADDKSDAFFQHGFLSTTGGGRHDTLKLDVPEDAYVIPADVVSGLGQGNSLHGAQVLDQLFPPKDVIHNDRARRSPAKVLAAGGEYVIAPSHVLAAGLGDMRDGHRTLDGFVKNIRAKTIGQMRKLPGPKQ